MKSYTFPGNDAVSEIRLEYGQYESDKDRSLNTVRILFRDHSESSWQSDLPSGGDVAVSANGKYVYIENRFKGIYCFHAKTGAQVWHNRRLAFHIIPNQDSTITCSYLKSIFVLSKEGNLIKEICSNQENAVKYLGDNRFLLKATAKLFKIIDGETLDTVCDIPADRFKGSIRSADLFQDILTVTYWDHTNEHIMLENHNT